MAEKSEPKAGKKEKKEDGEDKETESKMCVSFLTRAQCCFLLHSPHACFGFSCDAIELRAPVPV
eukprot:1303670-Rhodomonas_salina.3